GLFSILRGAAKFASKGLGKDLTKLGVDLVACKISKQC
uniref:Esculentin-2B n=1 Tax=Lithobates berlandieri TaxID=30360 RepID=ES2B_LITBE|nr:RecName: Full=Esculentin-2B [Lithobates berlandieri]